MFKKLALVFCSTGLVNCIAIAVTIQMIKDSYPVKPFDWLFLWVFATFLIAAFGLLLAFFVILTE